MRFFKWLIPTFFVLLGIFLSGFVRGHSFLGLICLCIAGIITVYYLLALLKTNHRMTHKVLSTVFSSILCFGLAVCAVTEVLVIHASLGDPHTTCEYVVVLGAKVNGTTPSLSLSDRINAAHAYLTEHPNTVAILSGGQGDDEGISEAQCMYDQLKKRGVPPSCLWLEDKATSTWENIRFSLDIIEEKIGKRPETIGLLSSEYHLFRARFFAKDCGVETIGIPAKTSWFTMKLNYFTREVAGIWHYIILGGQYHD